MAIKTGPGKVAQYTRYKQAGKYAANKRRRLNKLLKTQPNNKQIQAALDAVVSYSRKSANTHAWSKQRIAEVRILKPRAGVVPQQDKGSMFSIKQRTNFA